MPKGEKLNQVRPPKEARLKALGLDRPLEPGERSIAVRLRLPQHWAERVLKMTAEERGRVVELGLEALEVEHAQEER